MFLYDALKDVNIEENQPRPVLYLNQLTKCYPDISAAVNLMIELKKQGEKDYAKWADWCFIPFAGWYAYACNAKKMEYKSFAAIMDAAYVSFLGTWRYSQGIYKINPDLMRELIDNEIRGNIPSEVLFRLPEFCLYIEIPDEIEITYLDQRLYGFFVLMEHDVNKGRAELRFSFDFSGGLFNTVIHIGDWSIEEAVSKMVAVSNETLRDATLKDEYGKNIGVISKDVENNMVRLIKKTLPIVMYLCSDCPDIQCHESLKDNMKLKPSKTKKGWRLFPKEKPNFIEVGKIIGEKLKRLPETEGISRKMRAHLRRGHWHGYWRGSRKLEIREFSYKWIPPLIIAGLEVNVLGHE